MFCSVSCTLLPASGEPEYMESCKRTVVATASVY